MFATRELKYGNKLKIFRVTWSLWNIGVIISLPLTTEDHEALEAASK